VQARILVDHCRHYEPATLAMVFKLGEAVQKSCAAWMAINHLPKLITGVTFADGSEVVAQPAAPQGKAA